MIILKNKLKSKTVFLLLLSTLLTSFSKKENIASKKGAIFSYYQVLDTIKLNQHYNSILKKYKNENYAKALSDALILYDKYENQASQKHKHLITKLIAEIYGKSNKHLKSIKFYQKSLEHLKSNQYLDKDKTKDNYSLATSKIYLRLGGLYLKLYRDYKDEESKVETNNISKERQLLASKFRDSSIHFFNKVDRIPSLNSDLQKLKGSAYINLSGIYEIDSIYPKSKLYASKAIEIYKNTNDKLRLSKAQNNLANVHLSTGNFKKAKKLYDNAIKTLEKNTDQESTEFKSILFYNLAWAMRNLGEVEAYDKLEISHELEGFFRENELEKFIKQAENQHNETVKKLENDRKIAIAKAELEKENTDLMLAGLSLLILIISGVVIYNIKLRQKNLKLKLEQTKLVEKQKIDHLKSETQVKILNATIDGKETERKQIAETLHDSVSALLSSANMHLRATKKQFNGSTPVELEKTQDIILEASQKVRDLSHNLVSSILLKFGLEYAINDISKKYSNRELEFHTEISNVDRYSQEFEIKLYNVIHELINNIIKHSKASNAYIIIEERNDFLSVRIEDDGVGFDYKSSNSSSGGLGLNQIEARIQMMNGNFLVESGANQGSKITFSVPVQKKSQTSFV